MRRIKIPGIKNRVLKLTEKEYSILMERFNEENVWRSKMGGYYSIEKPCVCILYPNRETKHAGTRCLDDKNNVCPFVKFANSYNKTGCFRVLRHLFGNEIMELFRFNETNITWWTNKNEEARSYIRIIREYFKLMKKV